MYQILEVWSKIRLKSDFFPVKVGTYTVAYPRNSGYSTNHKYEKGIDYKNDIAILYRRIRFENLDTFRDFFLEGVGTYTIAYPRNSGYNTNHKYAKDIDYKSDIAILYQRKEPENLGMSRYFFREANIVIDE